MNTMKREKAILLWGLYLLVVLAVLWWVAETIARGAPTKKSFPTQGSGAAALMAPTPKAPAPRILSAIPLPSVTIPPPRNVTNTLAWDYPDLSTVTNFRLYRGSSPGHYAVSNLTGKVLTAPFVWTLGTSNWVVVTALSTNGLESEYSNEIRVPTLLTNLVITITTTNATNLLYTTRLGLPWTLLGATNFSDTNPPTRFWRAVGKRRSGLFIDRKWQ